MNTYSNYITLHEFTNLHSRKGPRDYTLDRLRIGELFSLRPYRGLKVFNESSTGYYNIIFKDEAIRKGRQLLYSEIIVPSIM